MMSRRVSILVLACFLEKKETILSLFIPENREGHVHKEGLDFCFFASEKQVEIVCFRSGPQTISNCGFQIVLAVSLKREGMQRDQARAR
jgi:hypothetical protein